MPDTKIGTVAILVELALPRCVQLDTVVVDVHDPVGKLVRRRRIQNATAALQTNHHLSQVTPDNWVETWNGAFLVIGIENCLAMCVFVAL